MCVVVLFASSETERITTNKRHIERKKPEREREVHHD